MFDDLLAIKYLQKHYTITNTIKNIQIYLCIGPFTNLAKVIDDIPKDCVIYAVGGCFNGGNVTSDAEYNVYSDITAFETVIQKRKIHLLTFDECEQFLSFDGNELLKIISDETIKTSLQTFLEFKKSRGMSSRVVLCDLALAFTITNRITTRDVKLLVSKTFPGKTYIDDSGFDVALIKLDSSVMRCLETL